MTSPVVSNTHEFTKSPVEITIKIAMTLVLVVWCFYIIKPFIVPLMWSLIIAVSVYPVFIKLLGWLGGRQKLTAAIVSFVLLVLIVGPLFFLGDTLVDNLSALSKQLSAGTLTIPLPTEQVASWPVIGETLFKHWTAFATKPMEALAPVAPYLKTLGAWLVSTGFSLTLSVLQLVLAIIVSGVLLANAEGGYSVALAISKRFFGLKGEEFERLSEVTIRGVATGVLGVALIQSLLMGLGFLVAGVPAAALLTVVCFFLAVIQIGPGLVALPVTIYVFSVHEPWFAFIYLIWSIFTGTIDNVLRPLLMGRGSSIPTVIIFLGAIGGMMSSGVIGLFVGAVVLALGYELFKAWIFEGQ
jgi:predicted PurR-regulated permease PerM